MKELLNDKDEIININKGWAATLIKQVKDKKDSYEQQITELTKSHELEKETLKNKISHEFTQQNSASCADINNRYSDTL